jgi:putative membrane protein
MKVAVLSLTTCLLAGVAVAQQMTPGATPPQNAPNANTQNPPNATVAPPNTTSPNSGNAIVSTNRTGNDNAEPAKGSNSFTEGQAKSRIEGRGFQNVADLKKDDNGVWRGTAESQGKPVHVWLDYKGNVGETP